MNRAERSSHGVDRADLLVRRGTVLFPDSLEERELNVAVRDGKISYLGPDEPQADRVIEAKGLFVSPGFVDSHTHDEKTDDFERFEKQLLLQGVTTAIGGNCGSGPLMKDILPYRQRPWINMGYLVGHRLLRENVGVTDVYAAAEEEQLKKMQKLLREDLKAGAFGFSLGLEYLPNTPTSEIEALLEVVAEFEKRWVPVHIREDGPGAVRAVDEIIALARKWPVRFQISHTASMTGFGELATVLNHLDQARAEGVDITFDAYPYDAFCTTLGSAVFDPGFAERWGKGLEALEIANGPYRGRNLAEDNLFERLRKEAPDTLIVAHVIHADEVKLCLRHKDCAIASDSLLREGSGHPRLSGSFPKALRFLVDAGLGWPEAVRKATSLPAAMNWLDKGVIREGGDADLVIFDGERLRDRATFQEPLLPPEGIAWVILAGEPVVKGTEVIGGPKGALMTREA